MKRQQASSRTIAAVFDGGGEHHMQYQALSNVAASLQRFYVFDIVYYM